MSETDKQRMSLVGVNPNSRTLKFLNTKNNIASMTLRKQLASFEREKTFSISSLETRRIDTQQFLKQVQNLEHDTDEGKKYLEREEGYTPPPQKPRIMGRRRRKIRLAQTAPAHVSLSDDEQRHTNSRENRKAQISGPETQAEKDHVLKVNRKKSLFLQLSGRGSQLEEKRTALPRPNPKTLLDVMVGLNAFSYVPSPQHSGDYESYRGDSRMSIDQESFYGSHENIAKKFMMQWKNKVASRKFSIMNKLEAGIPSMDYSFQRCESLTSVPEDAPRSSHMRHRKSKWTVRQSLRHPTLPSIDDEEERKVQFLAWVQDEKEKSRQEKTSIFHGLSSFDKQSQRRKSFTCWLQKRQQQKPKEDVDSDEEMGALRDISEDEADDEPSNMGDLMKTILKIKTRFKDPLDARVKRFNKEVEQIKKKDEEARNKPLSNSQRRRWKMLMHGIDAALADSSDDDDNYHYY